MSLADAGIDDRALAEMRAMAHPLRLRILSLLTGSEMTAADVARELGLTHANASYHLRHLLAAGTIEIAGEERIRVRSPSGTGTTWIATCG
jgi:DNA-binding transcriptional ArsR family regulator